MLWRSPGVESAVERERSKGQWWWTTAKECSCVLLRHRKRRREVRRGESGLEGRQRGMYSTRRRETTAAKRRREDHSQIGVESGSLSEWLGVQFPPLLQPMASLHRHAKRLPNGAVPQAYETKTPISLCAWQNTAERPLNGPLKPAFI